MTKPMLVTFPFTLLLLDVWPLGPLDSLKPPRARPVGRAGKASPVEKLP